MAGTEVQNKISEMAKDGIQENEKKELMKIRNDVSIRKELATKVGADPSRSYDDTIKSKDLTGLNTADIVTIQIIVGAVPDGKAGDGTKSAIKAYIEGKPAPAIKEKKKYVRNIATSIASGASGAIDLADSAVNKTIDVTQKVGRGINKSITANAQLEIDNANMDILAYKRTELMNAIDTSVSILGGGGLAAKLIKFNQGLYDSDNQLVNITKYNLVAKKNQLQALTDQYNAINARCQIGGDLRDAYVIDYTGPNLMKQRQKKINDYQAYMNAQTARLDAIK